MRWMPICRSSWQPDPCQAVDRQGLNVCQQPPHENAPETGRFFVRMIPPRFTGLATRNSC